MKPPYDRTDYELLDRYDSGDSSEGDRKVLAQMVSHGANLALPRHVIFFLYFPDSESAFNAAEHLRRSDYDARTAPRSTIESDNCWPAIAEKHFVVNEETMNGERNLLEAIAERHGGEFDGWEAAID